jgi:predicted DNA-binding protein (UPF0251 family)
MRKLQEINLTLDELEAVRLADLNGMYQEQAAQSMNISRPTFGRIIESAHKKIAEALVKGRVLRVEAKPGNLSVNNIKNNKKEKRYENSICLR